MAEEETRPPEKSKAVAKKEESRSALVAAVTSPLNFFALVVMICEAIIGTAAVVGKLSEGHLFILLMLMLLLLLILTGVVAFIAYQRPRHLSAEMAAALKEEVEEVKQMLGSDGFKEAVQQIVEGRFEVTRKNKP